MKKARAVHLLDEALAACDQIATLGELLACANSEISQFTVASAGYFVSAEASKLRELLGRLKAVSPELPKSRPRA